MKTLKEVLRENSSAPRLNEGFFDTLKNWLFGKEEEDAEYDDAEKAKLKESQENLKKEVEELKKKIEEFKKTNEQASTEISNSVEELKKDPTPKKNATARTLLKDYAMKFINQTQVVKAAQAELDAMRETVKKDLEPFGIRWSNEEDAQKWLQDPKLENIPSIKRKSKKA